MFIVLEGADGCGKSTIGKRLATKINAEYREFPDRTTATGKIINSWLRGGFKLLDPERDAIMLQSLITVNKLEALAWLGERMLACRNVVFSRWTPSAFAYGVADGCDLQWLRDIHKLVYEPDLCILLDVPVATSLARIGGRAEAYEAPARIAKVVERYRELWAEKRANGYGNWVVVDAARSVDDVLEDVFCWYEARRVDSLRR